MRKIAYLVCLLACGFAVQIGGLKAHAQSTASITMTLKNSAGVAVAGQQITCSMTMPQSGPYPSRPQFTYLTADGNGVASWQPTVDANATYSCFPRTTLTPDSCYSWPGGTRTSDMKLTAGEARSFNWTATATGTCGAPTTTTTQPTPQTNSTAPAATPAVELVVPQVTSITLGGKKITEGESPKVRVGQSFIISGTAGSKAMVVVAVHSDPVETPVVADESGKWSYDLAKLTQLPLGPHRVEVFAMDEATNKQTAKTAVLSFTLIADDTKAATSKKSNAAKTTATKSEYSSVVPFALATILLLALLSLAVWYYMRKKKHHSATTRQAETTPDSTKEEKDAESQT